MDGDHGFNIGTFMVRYEQRANMPAECCTQLHNFLAACRDQIWGPYDTSFLSLTDWSIGLVYGTNETNPI